MKKTSLLAPALLFFTLTHGQTRQGLWIAPGFHFGSGMVLPSTKLVDVPINFYGGGGIDAGYMFDDHIGIYSGLAYSITVYNLQLQFSRPYTQQTHGEQHQLEIPLFFRFITADAGKPGLLIDAGIKQGLLLATKTRIEDHYGGKTETTYDKSLYPGYSVAPFVYIAADLSKKGRPGMTLGLQIMYRITNTFSDTRVNTGHYLMAGIRLSVPVRCLKPGEQ